MPVLLRNVVDFYQLLNHVLPPDRKLLLRAVGQIKAKDRGESCRPARHAPAAQLQYEVGAR